MPANPVFGRAGQGYSGLGAMGRAQGAQSRFALPQTQTAMGRVGQRAAAGAGQMRQDYLSLWGRVAERERAEKIAALGDVGRELGLGIGKWRGRRADVEEERRKRNIALQRQQAERIARIRQPFLTGWAPPLSEEEEGLFGQQGAFFPEGM